MVICCFDCNQVRNFISQAVATESRTLDRKIADRVELWAAQHYEKDPWFIRNLSRLVDLGWISLE